MHRHHQHAHRHGEYLGILNSPRLQQDNLPRNRPPHLIMPEDPTLVKREPMPTTESDRVEPCAPGDNSGRCEKPTSSASNTVYPIVLGVVIPIVCAIVVLFFLHRRNLRKLRNEDANDKHRSLDFGLDFAPSGNKSMREKDVAQNHHMKGLSFDIGPSPYMLPPSLRNSKESLNSLSRSMMVDDDKYRHAHQYFNPENQSIRSQRRGYDDTVSVADSTRKGAFSDDMNQGLIGNAQRISRSSPPLHNSSGEPIEQSPVKHGQVPEPGFELHLPRSPSPVHISGLAPIYETSPATDSKEAYVSTSGSAPSSSLPEHQPDFPLRESLPGHVESTPAPSKDAPIPMPRISLPPSDGASDYGDERISNPIVPAVNVQKADSNPSYEADVNNPHMPILPDEPPQPSDLRLDPRRDTRRMTMGLRPLPPEDPADNPEQRANRIRSFYKEYFDESKAEQRETYYEDYGSDYYPYDDDYVYDPVTGEYFDAVPAPYAEPLNRRAMTPPPRAPPRFQGTPRHMASGSIGGYSGYSERFQAPGPRAFSSASGRFPGARGPRRPLPPPSPLTVLPSPHLLKDDAIMTAIDFAPGSSFKDQREGRPETPLGGMRPYSPMVRAHTPLVSVFDDLAPIPSPHQLRKSGAFDNLDFAPPPRFKTQDTASDAGSIRSNRTGVSAAHLQNIRTGAYRVSRLPPETVGTRDDLMSNLRPTWDMRQ